MAKKQTTTKTKTHPPVETEAEIDYLSKLKAGVVFTAGTYSRLIAQLIVQHHKTKEEFEQLHKEIADLKKQLTKTPKPQRSKDFNLAFGNFLKDYVNTKPLSKFNLEDYTASLERFCLEWAREH